MQNNENNENNENSENIDECINWIEDAVNKKHIKYYEFENFKNIQEIDSGGFGKVFRANWKCFDHYLALKFFFDLNNITLKEIINEVISLLLHFLFKRVLFMYTPFTYFL
jgi:hypothetical protein